MIEVEYIEVHNYNNAIRGMRNALNSWDKSDSLWDGSGAFNGFTIGEADLALARKLCRAGSDHRKFLRQIIVSMDITAPLYWWKEFDTYKVGTVANSCSTMHTIHKEPFELDDFSCEHLGEFSEHDNFGDTYFYNTLMWLGETINRLNWAREKYIETKDEKYWRQMIQLLPTSYNQKRTVTLDYEVLLNMYHARRNHKLDEWRTFCGYIETMPYFAEICLTEENSNVE